MIYKKQSLNACLYFIAFVFTGRWWKDKGQAAFVIARRCDLHLLPAEAKAKVKPANRPLMSALIFGGIYNNH